MPRLPEPISDEDLRAAAEEIVLAERARHDQAVAAVERVRALHTRSAKFRVTHHVCAHHAALDYLDRVAIAACPDCTVSEKYVCTHCRAECPDDDEWPCPTVRALEGEQ